jgi:alkylated DNA repair dioxygenase AlkB
MSKQVTLDNFLNTGKETPKDPIESIDGIKLIPNFITSIEEEKLIKCINLCKWDTRLARRTQHYGYTYDYIHQSCHQAEPIPEWCYFIVQRIKDSLGEIPDQVIINEYTPGQGIAPHTDSKIFGECIFSLSLGSDIQMNFSNKEKCIDIHLNRRSLICLKGDSRHIWKHGIVPRKTDNGVKRKTRISLTFRKLK